jgi:predicted DNA-binding transcriptional regulator AlpA
MELSTLPQGTPLMAKTSEATRLFGMSRTTLYRLRRDHKDFKALTIKTGREVLFDVPRVYEWFQQYGGGEIE